jgi:hypothetical protein
VTPGISGSIAPVRDPQGIADAILEWWGRTQANPEAPSRLLDREQFSFEIFAPGLIDQLTERGLAE